MPSAKKTTTKAKKVTTKRKPVAKKKPTKKVMQSFKCAQETEPFFTFKFTQQTLYWLIIALISATFVVWIVKIQSDINIIYNQVEQMQKSEPELPIMQKSVE